MKGCLTVFLVLFLLGIIGSQVNSCSDDSASYSEHPKNEYRSEKKQSLWIAKGRDAVTQKLKDPASAKFRNVGFHRGIEGIPVAYGEVNSKNSFGGYSGFQRFIYAGSSELTFLEEEVQDFDELWRRMVLQ